MVHDRLQYVADLPTRRRGRLRSSTSSLLDVRPSWRVTVGDRCFAAAGPLSPVHHYGSTRKYGDVGVRLGAILTFSCIQ